MKNFYWLILLLPLITNANNIVVSEVKLVNQDALNNIVYVQFNVNYHDAATSILGNNSRIGFRAVRSF